MNKNVFSNFIWRFLERCGAQAVTFVVSMVLARLLDPEVYGTVAIVTVITTILQVFIDSGFGTALIQKKDADDLDFSTVFFFNVIMCVVLYSAIFFLAPLIADFYKMPDLVPIIRVMSLTLVVSGVRNIQQAYISRNLLFKRFFFATVGATVCSAIIGIAMAFKGYGVWALVGQTLTNTTVSTIILWFTVKWRPKIAFSFQRFKALFSFGWKLLLSALLETVYNDLRQIIIGKMYSTSSLAFYNKGNQLPSLVVTNVNTSIDSVLLPTMSAAQDNRQKVKEMTRRSIQVSSYIMMPFMVGLAVCAKPMITLLFTEKWLPCVPYLQVFCFVYAFYPIHTANLNAIKAVGKSGIFLKLEIIKKVIGIAAVLITMWFGVMPMALSLAVTTVLSSFINAYPNQKLLNYRYFEQIKDIMPNLLLSVTMGAVVYCASFLSIPSVALLLIQVSMGVVLYVVGSAVFKVESFCYILLHIRKIRNKKQQ